MIGIDIDFSQRSPIILHSRKTSYVAEFGGTVLANRAAVRRDLQRLSVFDRIYTLILFLLSHARCVTYVSAIPVR